MELRIDPEFANRIPPLTEDEFKQLEENILADGVVINPIIVWDGVIIDGHNRFRIIQDHPHIQFTTYEKVFADRFAATAWICKNQLGRRNLTKQQKKYLIGKQYESEKASYGASDGFRGNQHQELVSSQIGNLPTSTKTCERIAIENGISKNSVLRAESFSKAVDIADEIEPGIRSDILSRKIKATAKDVDAIIQATPAERAQLIAELRSPPVIKKKKKTENEDKAKIQEISEDLAKPRGKPTQSDMFYELDDSLNGMIFRWNTCLAANADHLADEACYAQVQQRVQMGLDYLNQIKNGEMPK